MPDLRSVAVRPIVAVCAAACIVIAAGAQDARKLPSAAASYDFARDIKPILEANCVRCHGAAKRRSGFRLDTREQLLKGGSEHDQVIIEGQSDKSPLVLMAAGLVEDLEMPPKDEGPRLTTQQIGLLRAWIDAGAKWPDGVQLESTATAAETEATRKIVASLPPPAARTIDFVSDIQPLFKGACYECHGPRKQEGGLRFDHKATALGAGDSGRVIVPGKSADSPLIRLVATPGDKGMPRKGPRLTEEQIATLRAWIDQGAQWPDAASIVLANRTGHWAYTAPQRPPLPALTTRHWVKTPIDAFVLARIEKEGLSPAPEADKATLLRRLSLDLTGLPPTLQELDAFLADKRPDAYTRQVERLLASPHYGERWARHWLDAARYADSDGFEKDKPRFAWAYRDWVIDALNKDLPYDRFIVEQIAGDQLPNAGQDQVVATGYLRNSMINEEGGVDPEQFRMEAMFDRMDAIGKGVLGLTIQCAQCHDHKFDPIRQEEYYRLFAFLNNDNEGSMAVYLPADLMKLAEQRRLIGEIEANLRHRTPDWPEQMAKWEVSAKASEPQWTVVKPEVEDISTGGQRYLPQPDGSLLAQGYAPTKHEVKLTATVKAPRITAFRLELLTDKNLPLGGPGRSFKGTGALTEFAVDVAGAGSPEKPAPAKFSTATADFADAADTPLEPNFDDKSGKKRVTGPVSYAIDGKDETAWGIDAGPGRRNAARKAVFTLATPLEQADGTQLVFRLKQNHGGWNSDDLMTNNLGRFRLSYTDATGVVADPVPLPVREILAIPGEQRTEAQAAAVFSYWRTTVAAFKDANDRIAAIAAQHPEPSTSQLVLDSRQEARQTHVLRRGDWLKPGKAVRPGVPAALHALPANAPPTRLTFARWLVDRQSPTTARTFVNRVWQTYFGTGLVATSEDLGTQSEAPSHPELLDWLAVEFMERGWKQKDLHRLIVSSAVYRQSSRIDAPALEKDPYNRLLARGARFRVEGEIVRDIALAVSGLLNPAVGGRSVMPPAPDFLFKPPASYAPFPWVAETGPERYRRALYTYRRRTTPFPMLQTFDAPDGAVACIRRARSNTPLQALTLLNETVSIEAARAFALNIVSEGGTTDAQRVTYAFRRALSRPPSDRELEILIRLIEKQKARVAEGWVNTHALTTGQDRLPALPDGVTPAVLAGYTVAARALLSLDETITRQ